ncbi:hypothetical protein [Clavibacter nebraskensis]
MKNRYAPKVLALVAASSVIMLAGCTSSADAPSGDPKSLMTGTKEAPLEWDATTADGETFETLNAVSQAATVVIQGTAESSRVERVSEVPFTVTTVNVSSVVSGTHEGHRSTFASLAMSTIRTTLTQMCFRLGGDYLLYLEPFELEAGVPTGQYVIVGGVAAWEKAPSGELEGMAGESKLPDVVTQSDIQASLD